MFILRHILCYVNHNSLLMKDFPLTSIHRCDIFPIFLVLLPKPAVSRCECDDREDLIGWIPMLQIIHEYRKFPVRNPESIDHDHWIAISSSPWIRPPVYSMFRAVQLLSQAFARCRRGGLRYNVLKRRRPRNFQKADRVKTPVLTTLCVYCTTVYLQFGS